MSEKLFRLLVLRALLILMSGIFHNPKIMDEATAWMQDATKAIEL